MSGLILLLTQRDDSVKGLERLARGEAEPIHIASLSSKIPEFSKILRSGKNKTRLVELVVEYIDKNRAKVINILRCRKIVLSTLNSCTVVAHGRTTIDELLQSTQEEADTKVILQSKHTFFYTDFYGHITLSFRRDRYFHFGRRRSPWKK